MERGWRWDGGKMIGEFWGEFVAAKIFFYKMLILTRQFEMIVRRIIEKNLRLMILMREVNGKPGLS